MFSITIHSMLNLLAALFSLVLGVFIYANNKKARTNFAFLSLAIAVFIWKFCEFMLLSTSDSKIAIFWCKCVYLGSIFISISIYNISTSFFKKEKQYKIVLLSYLAGLIFFVPLSRTYLFVKDVQKYPWGFWYVPGVLFPLFLAFFTLLITASLYNLYLGYKKTTGPLEKKRAGYLFIAIIIATFGSVDYLPNYGIPIYPFGFLPVLACVTILAYTIMRYRLMDIEVIIRETAIFAGIFGFSVGVFVLAMMVGQQLLQPYIGKMDWIVPALALFIVTFAVRPIERLIYNTIGKFLFKKRYAYQKALQDAASGMAGVRDPKKLLKLIVHIVCMKMKLENVSILIYDDELRQYQLKAFRGEKKPRDSKISIKEEEPLIEWLKEKKGPVVFEELDKWIKDEKDLRSRSVLTANLVHIQDKMRLLNASVCVPSFYRNDLLGILVLGDKKSGDFFSQDDLNLFSALADEAAIAIKNSQLYSEIDEKAREIENLYQKEHRLFMHASVAFAAAIDARDPYTHGHSERVTNYSMTVLDYIESPAGEEDSFIFRQRLQIAAVLHDIGKIGVSDNILHKPEKLTPEETAEMQKHPAIGADIVFHIKGLRDLIGGIRNHHERYDGKGYPDGLKSDEIPFMAKIIAIGDTYDAMTSDRPYRKKLSPEAAKDEIKNNSAIQFDPYVVAAFLKAFDEGKIKSCADDNNKAKEEDAAGAEALRKNSKFFVKDRE